MLRSELSLQGVGTPADTQTTTPAGLDVHPLPVALHLGTERGHHPGQSGQEELVQVHHLLGKGPAPVTATTKAGLGTKGTTEIR